MTASECIAKKPLLQHAPEPEREPQDDEPAHPAGDEQDATTQPPQPAACRASSKRPLGVIQVHGSATIYEDEPADAIKPETCESNSAPLQQQAVQKQQQQQQLQGREAKASKAAQAAERRALAVQDKGPANDTPTQTDQFFCASRQIDFGTTPLAISAPVPVPIYAETSTAAPIHDVTPVVKGKAIVGLASRPPLPSCGRGTGSKTALAQADEHASLVHHVRIVAVLEQQRRRTGLPQRVLPAAPRQ